MKLQRLFSLTRKALIDYSMIEEGDHIAIGISGGKDSLTLLYALAGLRKFYPINFTITAITVDLGQGIQKLDDISLLCKQNDVDFHIVSTTIGEIIFEKRMEKSPCALCSKMRKGALNDKALSLGCNKIAYAHHKDDVIDTMFLSLMYEGRFHTFSPVTKLDKTGLTLIRPLIYCSEYDIIGFKNKYNLPVAKNPCPVDGHTKRQYVKDLIKNISHENKGVKDRFMRAILDSNIDGWKL
jgi:tRNA(Ile)-lysidine synthase TilS/MesJ